MDLRNADPFIEAARGLDLPPAYIHRTINVGASITLPAGGTMTEICAYKVPAGLVAVIRFLANGCKFSSDLQSVMWSLVVDGGDVVGYSNFFGMLSPGLRSPQAVAMMLRPGQRISWVAANQTAADIAGVAAMFRGWMWSEQLRPIGENGNG